MKKPTQGGSYLRDPETGKLTLVAQTAPAPGRDAPKAAPAEARKTRGRVKPSTQERDDA